MSFHYGPPPQHYYTNSCGRPHLHEHEEYEHYVPQYYTMPMKHTQKAGYNPLPRVGGWYSPAADKPNFYELNVQYSVPREGIYNQPVYIHDSKAEYADVPPTHIYREPNRETKHTRKPSADIYYGQAQITDEQPKQSRSRRSSITGKISRRSKQTRSTPKATKEDAIRAGIPLGYSVKHWDPAELPIILLGSVFDGNSLGKWIYDWTSFHRVASTPTADMAGELWLLLIKLAGKIKRAEESADRIHDLDKRETVEDFIIGGHRLLDKLRDFSKSANTTC